MKRMALIAVLLLILALLPAALADTQPSVSFTTNQITAQCGNTVTLTLAANAAPSRDITINITDERGNPFPVVLRQGETRATLQVTTARAGYNKRYEYANSARQRLSARRYPRRIGAVQGRYRGAVFAGNAANLPGRNAERGL